MNTLDLLIVFIVSIIFTPIVGVILLGAMFVGSVLLKR